MKIVRSGLLILVAACVAMQSVASEVDSASVTTFQSGTTLSSQQLNTTINALVTAVNDNAARIAELEAAAQSSLSVSGKSYCLHSIEAGFFLHSPLSDPNTGPYPLGTARASQKMAVSFNSDGSGTASVVESDYKEAFPGSAVIDQSDSPGSQGFTWTQTGNKLVLTFSTTDIAKVGVSNSGQVILGGGATADTASDGSGIWYMADHFVGIQVDNASSCTGMFSN